MFSKNQKVQVSDYITVRTIYQNAEYTPGKSTNHKGYIGYVEYIEDNGDGTESVCVRSWNEKHQEWSYNSHPSDLVSAING